MPSLEQEIAQLHSGDHLCVPYSSPEQQLAPLTAFAFDGLSRGERLLFAGEPSKLAALMAALERTGIDTRRLQERGAVRYFEDTAARRRNGRLDVEASLAQLESILGDATRAGFTGVRGVWDMTAPPAATDLDAIVAYETRLNKEIRRRPLVAMCQMDQRAVPPAALCQLLRAHPKAVTAEHVCTNPYYEPPIVLDEPNCDGMRFEWMLRQLARAHRQDERQSAYAQSLAAQAASLILEATQRRHSEEELARRLQFRDAFLSMASEALATALASIRDAEPRDSLATCLAFLETIAEQMHDIARVPGRRVVNARPLDLAEAVREWARRQPDEQANEGCALRVAADEPVCGQWDDKRVEQLLDSLLARAVRNAPGQPVVLVVERDGPQRARLILRTGAQPPPVSSGVIGHWPQLNHAATIWIPRAIAESMSGALTATGTPGNSEEIVVELPSATSPP